MSSMTGASGVVVGGVDTHSQTHHAAVIDQVGREVGDREFPATSAGYGALVGWLRGFGELSRVGVEGTSSYGAGLTRYLHQAGVAVLEIDRPDRRARRGQGKSDPLDAYAAARAALSGTRTVLPKSGDGIVEAIRALRVARRGAVKARTQTINQLKSLLVTAPPVFDHDGRRWRRISRKPYVLAGSATRWGACSGATANARLDALRSAAGWWRHQDWITTDPTRRIRRRPRTPDRTRSVGKPDIDALLTRPALALRERTLWRLLYETAARAEEVLGLDIEELDLRNRRAKVRRKGGAADIIIWRTHTA
ncbi:MAG: IS110 family transposase [Pseudonocardia sp.]